MTIQRPAISNTTDTIIRMSRDNIDPMHPIGKVILSKIAEKHKKSPQMCFAWAERLLSKKDEGEQYLNAGSDWLNKAIFYAHLDRRPELLFNDIIKLTKKHFNQETLVDVLQKASRQCPKDRIINRRLKEETIKLANIYISQKQFDDAIELIEDFQSTQQHISNEDEIILEEILDDAYGSIEPETIDHAEEQRGYQAYEIEP